MNQFAFPKQHNMLLILSCFFLNANFVLFQSILTRIANPAISKMNMVEAAIIIFTKKTYMVQLSLKNDNFGAMVD